MIKLFCFSLILSCAACSTLKKPFFWEIEKDGKTSYLLGTIHAQVGSDELPEFVNERFKKSNGVGTEIVQEFFIKTDEQRKKERKDDLTSREEYNKKNNLKVSRFFTPEEWQKIVKILSLKPERLEYVPVERLYNWVLVEEKSNVYFGMQSNWGELDRELMYKAAREKKLIYRLDSFERMSIECKDIVEVDNLKNYLKDGLTLAENRARNLNMLKKYREGDELYFRNLDGDKSKEYIACMLAGRNERWVQVIEEVHRDNPPFFAMGGVAHFLGVDNVIGMLEKRGFKVTRKIEP